MMMKAMTVALCHQSYEDRMVHVTKSAPPHFCTSHRHRPLRPRCTMASRPVHPNVRTETHNPLYFDHHPHLYVRYTYIDLHWRLLLQ